LIPHVALVKQLYAQKMANNEVLNSAAFWLVTPVVQSSSQRDRCFGAIYRLQIQGRKVSEARNQQTLCIDCGLLLLVICFTHSSPLKLEAIYCTETSDSRTTPSYNPEEPALHSYRCENFKSNRFLTALTNKSKFPFHMGLVQRYVSWRSVKPYLICSCSFSSRVY
jgi:hypothetical protein